MVKKENPIVYKIYEYLKENAVGEENKKTSREIMVHFGIRKSCTLRGYIRRIRDNEQLQKVVCSKAGSNNNGYWIGTNQIKTYKQLILEKNRYLEGLKRTNTQIRKLKKHNSLRFRLFGKEKEIYESIIEQKKFDATNIELTK